MSAKFTVKKSDINAALGALQPVTSGRSTLPILSNVAIRAEKDFVVLLATDLDRFVWCRVPGVVTTEGATTLPSKKLFALLRESTTPEISISVDDKHKATIECGTSQYKLMGLGIEEYVAEPKLKEVTEATIPQDVLRSALKFTGSAMSSDETRYVLNGVYLALNSAGATVVGTDGRRMAMQELAVTETTAKNEVCGIIPAAAVQDAIRLLGETDDCKVKLCDGYITFILGDTRLTTKLIEGTYPNYKQVIPGDSKEQVVLGREAFCDALSRASLMTSAKSESVKLVFSMNKLVIRAHTAELGEAEETMDIKYTGHEMSIAFNPLFIINPLRQITEENVTLGLSDELSPGVIKTDKFRAYVVMPLRMS